jgi:hypothetical protein
VLAGQLAGEHAEAAGLGQGVLLAVQQLAGGADPGVPISAPVRTAGSGARRLPGTSEVSESSAATPGTAEETTPGGLIDTPALRHVFSAHRAVIGMPCGQKLIMS